MNRLKKTGIRRWFVAMTMAVAGVLSVACLKDDNQKYQVAAVRALNAVPGSGQLDIFLNQNKLNFNSSTWQDEEFAYTDTLPYKNAWPNNRVVSVVDTVDYPNATPLVQKTVNFMPGRFYSLYVVGYDELEVLVTDDDLTDPAPGMAKVRVIHLSPDAATLDFEIQAAGNGSPLQLDDHAFKEVSDFESVEGGITYTVDFIEHGSGQVLHTFEFTPQAEGIYTVWVKGLVGMAGDAESGFGHGVITH